MTSALKKNSAFIVFGVYFFSFMLLESMVNDQAAALLGAQAVTATYACGLLCTMAGYLAYSLFFGNCQTIKSANRASGVIGLAAAACVILFIYFPSTIVSFSCAGLGLVLVGFLGGASHHLLSIRHSLNQQRFGTKLGTAASMSIVVQYFSQNVFDGAFLLICCVLATAALFLGLSFFGVGEDLASASRKLASNDASPDEGAHRKLAFSFVVAVALMTVICSLNDNFMVVQNASGNVELFGPIRLVYALALLLAGVLSDYSGETTLPFSATVAMTLSTAAILLLSDSSFYQVNMAIMYFYSGFYVMFLTLGGIRLAQRLPRAGLWAGMGRIVRCAALAVATFATMLISFEDNLLVLATFSCVLYLALFALLFWSFGIRKDLSEQQKAILATTDEEVVHALTQRFGLTQREEEVLFALISTEKTNQEIAEDLLISRRVLQRHISAIYEKTGASSRIGLVRLLIP